MDERKTAEFNISDMLPIGITLVVLVIALAFGLNVVVDVQSDFTADSAEFNATQDGITGISNLTSKIPLIATVVVAAIVIGILLRYLFVKFNA